eukprot:3941190-Rhodomonas_salina.2
MSKTGGISCCVSIGHRASRGARGGRKDSSPVNASAVCSLKFGACVWQCHSPRQHRALHVCQGGADRPGLTASHRLDVVSSLQPLHR